MQKMTINTVQTVINASLVSQRVTCSVFKLPISIFLYHQEYSAIPKAIQPSENQRSTPMQRSFLKWLTALGTASLLAACGGGGGGDSPSSTPSPTASDNTVAQAVATDPQLSSLKAAAKSSWISWPSPAT
jgi:hypothetical protein